MQDEKNAVIQMRFPQKLWYLLNLRTDAILWGGTGRTILLNYKILGKYLQCDHSIFKTTNISSFVRQLNLYGFRKVTSHLQDPLCNSSNPYMHEYVHDYFQFGRPELLTKIIRKALSIKKTLKPKILGGEPQSATLTPLEKARHALRVALKKAAQDNYIYSSPKQVNVDYDAEDIPEDFEVEDEDQASFDWMSNIKTNENETILPDESHEDDQEITVKVTIEREDFGEKDIMNFNDEGSQQGETDNFPAQFLSMPDLDAEAPDNHGIELLAEFDINNDQDDGIAKKIGEASGGTDTSLNCVLPSISDVDQIDVDVAMAERNAGYSSYYNSEWDQMFNDMMHKNSSQEASDMKELYSQISKTIDLLNS